jgi:hypothetical protein
MSRDSRGHERGVPEATAIILTTAERSELEGLGALDEDGTPITAARPHRAIGGTGHREPGIGRTVYCTTGTASKWRVRYGERRFDGLDETGDRGAEPKYTAEMDQRVLAMLDQPKPKGYAR